MSCWVSLSIASSFWNVPLSELLQQVSSNTVASRVEAGILQIDIHRPANRPRAAHESELPEVAGDLEKETFGDWRAARAATARSRKAPICH
ncbi:MAG TPA: hypothetical protein VGB55_01215 [Tepidisphaeraceae bacterium]|jgi:hypothetical protein